MTTRHRKLRKTSEKRYVPRKIDFIRVGGWYRVGRLLGSGGSRSIYLGKDIRTTAQVALKIGHVDRLPSGLTYEYDMYKATAGCTGISPVCQYGKEGPYEVIVLEHIGTSLGDLLSVQQFDLRKTFLYAPQMLSVVESLHTQHYIHYHSIVGTLPFTSINGQLGNAQSCHNDLESLAYTIICLARGDLPWTTIPASSDQEAVLQKKSLTTAEELCEGLPASFCKFVTYVHSLGFDEKSDYQHLHSILSQCSQPDTVQTNNALPSARSPFDVHHTPVSSDQV
ncbi:kinase-like domain-containing protein [Lactarius hengduanensis]|nr:kinase-like domain-containing protein [Lactarius hengduanensis]